jgi:hypothetical protein
MRNASILGRSSDEHLHDVPETRRAQIFCKADGGKEI